MSLRTNYDNHEIEIRFGHMHRSVEDLVALGLNICGHPKSLRRCSVAEVIIDDNSFSQGFAVCHPRDRFNKSFGRKKAMTNAIQVLDQPTRKAIWSEYRDRIGV